MENHFEIQMTEDQLRGISSIGLAHMGDAVFELLVRSFLCASGKALNGNLHRATVDLVCAPAQAARAERMLPLLTEEEADIYRRGRNAKSPTMAKNATMSDYRKATGFEALMGWLYLQDEFERLVELVKTGVDGLHLKL